MKKYLILIIIAFSIVFSSCENWFDVRPTTQIKANELFEDQIGFTRALTGVYSLMSHKSIYGGESTFAMMEVFADTYTGVQDAYNHYYEPASLYDYDHQDVKPVVNLYWANGYNAIVNCNNILENIEAKKEIFSDGFYEIIKGEALALRAFLHFDLLRMFAPAPMHGLDAPAIPYVDKVTVSPFKQLTIDELVAKVVADLVMARDYLEEYDPMLADGYYEDWIGNSTTESGVNDEGFLLARRERLNYYAVTGLLARVHLYRGTNEDKLEAVKYANQVITSDIFPLWTIVDFESLSRQSIVEKSSQEFLFGCYKQDLSDRNDVYFTEPNHSLNLHINDNTRDIFFEVAKYGGAADWRNNLFFEGVTGYEEEFLNKYRYENRIPLIKVAEMYLILAECTGNADYLSTLRKTRGLKRMDENAILDDELAAEYRKEFLGEGQMFFYFKRKNIYPSADMTNVSLFTFPVPENEIEFGDINN